MSEIIERLQQSAHETPDHHAAHALHSAIVEIRRVQSEADRLREMLDRKNRLIDEMATQRECAKACMGRAVHGINGGAADGANE